MSNDLRNPTDEDGFVWEIEPVSKQAGENPKDRVEVGKGPIMVVRDVAKFDAVFPGLILNALDGSSIRVQNQGIVRRMLLKDKHVTEDAMKDAVIASFKGVRTRSAPAPKFMGADGKTYTSEIEAKAASKAFLLDQGIAPEVVAQMFN